MLLRKTISVAGLLASNPLAAKTKFNWQKHGTCGVPTVQSSAGLFNDMAARALGVDANEEDHQKQSDLNAAIRSVWENTHVDADAKAEAIKAIYTDYHREQAREDAQLNKAAGEMVNGDWNVDSEPVQSAHLARTRRSAEEGDKVYYYQEGDADTSDYSDTVNGDDDKPDMRIVGGEEAKKNSWPWQVFVKFGFDCGGALIDDEWVITAAHCISTSSNALRSAYVRVGAHVHTSSSSMDTDLGTRIAIEKVIVHPDYNAQNFKHDMALLKLKKPAIPKDSSGNPSLTRVAPICLAGSQTCFTKRTPCVVTGWGVNNADTWERHDTLQEVSVRLMSTAECTTHPTYKAYFHEPSMLCGGWAEGGKDACAGDSGGPLVCRVPETRTMPDGSTQEVYGNQWVLYGLVSWGLGCAKSGQPGVYTNVPMLSDWVRDTIRDEDRDLSDWQVDDYFNFGGQCKSWDQQLEEQWKKDISTTFVGQKPALSTAEETEIVQENEKANVGCDISSPVLAFNGVESAQDPNNPSHVFLPLSPEEYDVMISPVPNKVFWWSKWTKLDQVYPRNQNCSFILTNTDDEMRIKLTVVRAKIDCSGLTAPKSVRHSDDIGETVGDNLAVISDTINMNYQSTTVACPYTANVKKTVITMYAAGVMKLLFSSDNYLTKDAMGNPALKQRYDGGFIVKANVVAKYSDCNPGINKKHFANINDRIFIKSPSYPRFYSGDSQCRIHFTVGRSDMKLVYKILKMELKTRMDVCSPDQNDAILWLNNNQGCSNDAIFSSPGVFKEEQLVDQNCGKSKKQKTYTDLNNMKAGCFIFAANGAKLQESSKTRTGRFLVEIKAVHENYVNKKKRKKRSLDNGMPLGPLGLID
jgi:hypothetical protein